MAGLRVYNSAHANPASVDAHWTVIRIATKADFVKDSRSSTRHVVNIDVTVTYQETSTDQVMVNLSLGGALITVDERLPLGSSVDLVFRVPTADVPISVRALVRWVGDDSTGVQFDGLRAREVWSLNELFKKLQS